MIYRKELHSFALSQSFLNYKNTCTPTHVRNLGMLCSKQAENVINSGRQTEVDD